MLNIAEELAALRDEVYAVRQLLQHIAARLPDETAKKPKTRGRKVQTGMPVFEEAWAAYPKRTGGNNKGMAATAWAGAVKRGESEDAMLLATHQYAAFIRATNREGTPYVMQASTFYGPNARWKEDWTPPTGKADETDDILSEVARAYA